MAGGYDKNYLLGVVIDEGTKEMLEVLKTAVVVAAVYATGTIDDPIDSSGETIPAAIVPFYSLLGLPARARLPLSNLLSNLNTPSYYRFLSIISSNRFLEDTPSGIIYPYVGVSARLNSVILNSEHL